MKKLLLSIVMVLTALTGLAQQTGDFVYVYRHSGQTDAFLRNEIKEFYYSYEDTLGVTHDEIASQCIALEDSIYMIPLSDLDSISFVTPPTVLQPGVITIDEKLMGYVENSDNLTVVFAASTPSDLLPKVGDKLVTTEMNEKFPMGFAGLVKSVNGTTAECEPLKLEEVFKTYYNITVSEGYQEGSARRRAINTGGEQTFKMPTWSMDFGTEFSLKTKAISELAIKGGNKFEVAVSPEFKVKTSFIVNERQGTQLSVDITGDYDVQETVGLFAGLEVSDDFLDKEVVKVPVAPLTAFYLKPGLFYKAALVASLSGVWKQHYVSKTSFRFNSKDILNTRLTNTSTKTSSESDIEACLDGSIAFGAFLEIGVTLLSSDIDKICLRGEFGTELVGHFVLYNSDVANASKSTKVYEALRQSEVTWNVFLNTAAQIELGPWGISKNLPFNLNYNIAKWDLVPTFDQMEFEQCYSPRTSADARAAIKGNCAESSAVGFWVFSEEGEDMGKWKAEEKYKKGGRQLTHRFDNLEDDGDYVLYPMVNWRGFDLLANPSVGIQKNDFPVSIISFEQTGSHYSSQQGYEYEGINYFYKFNATTTVQLSDAAENIKDWGYVYHDFYGVDKKISCANLGGRTFADTRYAYYYNDTQRTVELSPYVQFNGDTDILIGKRKVYHVEYVYSGYSCPDEHHPHAIDLGLPSGTLWSCCNVGAAKPEDFGGYYRWGETKEISGDAETYEFFDVGSMTFQDIGADIAGTQYDVAHVEWGKGWKMPTEAQLTELKENCNFEFEYQEDLSSPGYLKLTGPSGSSILIPAAGAKIDASSYDDDHSPVNYKKTESSDRYEYFGQLYSSTRSNVLGSAVYMAFRPRYYIWYYANGKTEVTKDFLYYSVYTDIDWTTVMHGCSIRPVIEGE